MSSTTFFPNDVPARLDGLSVRWMHLFVMIVCGLGLFLEVMEVSFGNSLAAIFSTPAHSSSAASIPLLLSSVYIGAIFGTPAFGLAADRYGRRKTLVAVLALLAVSSGWAAASPSIGWLIVARALTGVSIGAYQPAFVAYITDLLPPRQRGFLFFSMVALSFLGFPAGTFLIRLLSTSQPLGIEAWRWGCIAGSGGAVVVALLSLLLPESPRWLFSRGRVREAEVGLRRFETSYEISARDGLGQLPPASRLAPEAPASGRRVMVILAMFFVSPWATTAFPILTGAVLMSKGFNLSDALLYVGLSTFGPVIGTLLAAAFIDYVPRRSSILVCALVMLVSGYAFANSDAVNWLVAANLVFTIATALYVPLLNVYCAELLPTQSRAGMFSGAWTANRVGAAIAPLCLLPLLHALGASAMFSVIAGSLVIGILLLGASMPGRERLPVL